MRVTIWDLDYYYAKRKVNCFNPDVMRISSYHKQRGDKVNFVQTEYDIHRPYDLYYIIKEKDKTPNAPMEFYLDSKVRWWGTANRARINWKMDAVMLGCRPDYLLYPEKNTRQERAEQIRLFDNKAKLLPLSQDYSNTFKDKDIIVTDPYMWLSSKKSLLEALELLRGVKNVSFSKPIRLDLIVDDKDITNKFLELNLTNRSKLVFSPINFPQFDAALEFLKAIRNKGNVAMGGLIVKYNTEAHWKDFLAAYRDFCGVKRCIVKGRDAGIRVIAAPLKRRLDTPYFHLFEEINRWTGISENISWFEYLQRTHPRCNVNLPCTWDDAFRDLLRQTYEDHDFFLVTFNGRRYPTNEVPWTTFEKEFKYGI